MIESALREVGAARSIVVDEDGVILAGNATVEAAAAAGIERVLTVQADGNTLVAVQRIGLTPTQKNRLKLFDNRAPEFAEWDEPILATYDADETAGIFRDEELSAILARLDDTPFDPVAEWGGMPEYESEDKRPSSQLTVYFASDADKATFGDLIGQNLTDKTRWVWHPARPVEPPVRWVE